MPSDCRVTGNSSVIRTAGHDERNKSLIVDSGLRYLSKNQSLAFNIYSFLTVAKLLNFQHISCCLDQVLITSPHRWKQSLSLHLLDTDTPQYKLSGNF